MFNAGAMQGQAVSWVTPMGLPIIQPYRKSTNHDVTTVLQKITLAYDTDDLPVSSMKQKSALPPNFVHSLDATHMLMTCLQMKNHNKTFAAVHDSFWTHPCDVEDMNKVFYFIMPCHSDMLLSHLHCCYHLITLKSYLTFLLFSR